MGNPRLTVRVKLLGGFGIVLLLTAVVGGFALMRMSSIANETQTLYNKHTVGIDLIRTAEGNVIASGRAEKNAILASDPAEIDRHIASSLGSLAAAREALDQFEQLVVLDVTHEQIAELNAIFDNMEVERAEVLADAREGLDEEALIAAGILREDANAADAIIELLVAGKQQLGASSAAEAADTYQSARTLVIGLILVAIAAGAGIGFWLARGLSNGINEVMRAAEGIASGDLRQTVNVTSNDELGDMAKSFEQMVAFLGRTMSEVRRAAAALDGQRRSLDAVALEASQTTDAVANGSEEVSRASIEVANTIAQVADGANQQANSVQEVNETLSELSRSVSQVSDGAQQQVCARSRSSPTSASRSRRRHSRWPRRPKKLPRVHAPTRPLRRRRRDGGPSDRRRHREDSGRAGRDLDRGRGAR